MTKRLIQESLAVTNEEQQILAQTVFAAATTVIITKDIANDKILTNGFDKVFFVIKALQENIPAFNVTVSYLRKTAISQFGIQIAADDVVAIGATTAGDNLTATDLNLDPDKLLVADFIALSLAMPAPGAVSYVAEIMLVKCNTGGLGLSQLQFDPVTGGLYIDEADPAEGRSTWESAAYSFTITADKTYSSNTTLATPWIDINNSKKLHTFVRVTTLGTGTAVQTLTVHAEALTPVGGIADISEELLGAAAGIAIVYTAVSTTVGAEVIDTIPMFDVERVAGGCYKIRYRLEYTGVVDSTSLCIGNIEYKLDVL